MPIQSNKNWYALKIHQCFRRLDSSKNGLTDKQVERRQKMFGKNTLPSGPRLSALAILLSQIKSPLVYVLLIAGVISLFLNHLTDAIVIFFAVFINTTFGFWQENKANNAIAHLKKIVRQQAKVIRNGRQIKIDSSELVPGDIIFLRPGDKVPADARLIEADNLRVIEATLTGESEPSKKRIKFLAKGTSLADRENMVYLGTLVARGNGQAVVCQIGRTTEVGKISQLISETKEDKTPLQLQLIKFSRWLTIFIVVISLIVFVAGLLVGQDPAEIFLTAVALAVAAIPEGLLVAVTVILTMGMQVILKKKALVRKLIAAETLGSTSIICTDKTGTLTDGRMQVTQIITADRDYVITKKTEEVKLEKVQDLISKVSVLCSDAVIENPDDELEQLRIIGDPTEKALLLAAISSGFNKDKLDKEYIRLAEVPFSSESKFMATLNEHQDKSHRHIFIKGAPEKVFDFSSQVLIGGQNKKITKDQLLYLKNKYENLTRKGLRLLAVAYKTGHNYKDIHQELNDLVFLGFIALKDPLRPEAKEAIQLCYRAGIRPIVITGDHRLTAKAIFEELGIKVDGNMAEGKDLDNWTDEELMEKVGDIDIYARVEPRHKLRVVDAWQAKGEVVAMTGDGINDAPALKSADIGIALGNGSDVTKETADIILLDNNFSVIVAAVEQGRVIFDNIRKVLLYLLCDSFSEIILVAGAILASVVFFDGDLPLPILASQILWINLVNDILPNIAIAMEPGEKEVMKDRPRDKDESILNKEMKILIFIIGIITNLILFGIFIYLFNISADINYIRTIIFAVLGVDSLLYAFSVRSLRHSIFTKNPFSNMYLILAVAVSFIFLLAAMYLPGLTNLLHTSGSVLSWEWIFIIGFGLLQMLLIEIVKHYFIVNNKRTA